MAKKKTKGEELFLEKDYNCAESTIIYANEKYGLNITDEDIKLLSAFGGGMCSGMACGALSGSIAAIGKMTVEERAHVTEDFHDTIADYVKAFRKEFGSTSCARLKKVYRKEDVKCLELVDRNFALLDEYVAGLKK